MKTIDKTPLKSKKFIAFFFSILVLAGILVAALVTQKFTWAMVLFMSIGMLAISAMSIGYVLSQAALDKFIQGVGQLRGGLQNDRSSEDSME
jgi:hypothetical protein